MPDVRDRSHVPNVGDKAPPLALPDQNGKTVRLSDLKGGRVVVTFYAEDFTPVCDVQVCGLRDLAAEFRKRDVRILAVSPDPVESHARYAKETRVPFPLLSDPDKTAMKAWDSWGAKSMYGRIVEGILRNTFIVGVDGRIEAAFLKIRTPGHAERVLAALDDAPPAKSRRGSAPRTQTANKARGAEGNGAAARRRPPKG